MPTLPTRHIQSNLTITDLMYKLPLHELDLPKLLVLSCDKLDCETHQEWVCEARPYGRLF